MPTPPAADRSCERDDADAAVIGALRAALPAGPLLLAVSGGLDSSVLLDGAARVAPAARLTVATFDHGTGPAATAAADAVAARAAALGLPLVRGVARAGLRGEAGWRVARWGFLRAHAAALGATVVTAHTLDDHVETIVLRILRGAGARGLAALLAPAPGVARPLLRLRRATLERCAAARGLEVARDPSNASRAFARNRVRLDLLPALRRANAGVDRDLLDVAARAALWRAEVDAMAARLARAAPAGGVRVARASLAALDAEGLAVLWPAVAARAGVTLDRRGTRRLATFTNEARTGAVVPLSGAVEARCERDAWWIGPAAARADDDGERPLADGARLGAWCFRASGRGGSASPWSASFDAAAELRVRAWRPGDRLAGDGRRAARRVKRWLAEAGVPGSERRGWPVVVVDGDIVWIPGVRRSDAASARPGRPGLHYDCDRNAR